MEFHLVHIGSLLNLVAKWDFYRLPYLDLVTVYKNMHKTKTKTKM